MKKSRYTEEQVAYALRLAESGTPVADVCRQIGIAEATFYLWKKKYGRLDPSQQGDRNVSFSASPSTSAGESDIDRRAPLHRCRRETALPVPAPG